MPDSDDLPLPATVEAPLVARSTGDLRPVTLADTDDADERRYEARSVLGKGGMGEVRLVRDARVGRDVAMKVMRAGAADRQRFLREARVQGQLEHPSIVPVYDLARGGEEPFFTMKRVRGMTLEHATTFTRRKLLSAFVSVCLAIDFAHRRGVVHRDLKPANIMLGDFGEVYVLDWGIAKLVNDAEPEESDAPTPSTRYATQGGMVLGTAGYMAPEQLRGDEVDGRTDVYALGAILFELLVNAPLNDGTTITELTQSTLAGARERIRERCAASDVPPELEAICARATMLERDERFATARALSDAVERYLDGDRDLARRRELADRHAAAASSALTASKRTSHGDDVEARSKAMLESGRALALDPDCEAASRTLLQLMTTPPSRVPDEVEHELRTTQAQAARVAGTAGVVGYACILAMVPLLMWMGVRSWPLLAVGIACILVGAVCVWSAGRMPRHGRAVVFAMFVVSAIFLGIVARLFGPLLATPMVAVGLAITGGFHPYAGKWTPPILACAGFLVPFALELGGVIDSSYAFDGSNLVLRPMLASLPRVPTLIYLAASSTTIVAAVCAYVIATRGALERAQRAVLVQSWQLRQLVPDRAKRTE